MTRNQPATALDLNRTLSAQGFDLANYDTLADLLVDLGIDNHQMYMFIGKRSEQDRGIPLTPESSLNGILRVVVISHHIGG